MVHDRIAALQDAERILRDARLDGVADVVSERREDIVRRFFAQRDVRSREEIERDREEIGERMKEFRERLV